MKSLFSCKGLFRPVAPPFAALSVCFLVVGCASTPTSRMESPAGSDENGYVFYLDGSGGTTATENWSGKVREGLLDGGYQGTGEIFTWEKGSGLKANEDASTAYKRKRADELTWEIEDRLEEFPDAPVEIIGSAAGSAVVLYALEALPESIQVQNVVLLGASMAEDYDLTEALKRVKGSLTVFTSAGAGLVVPEGADEETTNLYAEKVQSIPWDATLAADGGEGPEVGQIDKEFIRDQVAPLLMGGGGFIFDTNDGSALFWD